MYWMDEAKAAKYRIYHPRQDPAIMRGETGAGSRKYDFRCRLLTDHEGRYEVETVIPPPYFDPDDVCECKKECLCAWRCPHIHLLVQPTARLHHAEFITQVYFEGLPYNDTDKHFNEATMISGLSQVSNGGETWLEGTFDVVLPAVN